MSNDDGSYLGRKMLDEYAIRCLETDIGRIAMQTPVDSQRYRRERPQWLRDRMMRIRAVRSAPTP